MFNPKDNLTDVTKGKADKLLEISEISLLLKGYDFIFSDFDPRSYHERSLSDDFLSEAKKVTVERGGEDLELNLMVPHQMRNTTTETVIKKRLHQYFSDQASSLGQARSRKTKRGWLFVVIGTILMFVATWLLYHYHQEFFISVFLVILLEPAGWFFFWEGLDDVIYEVNFNRGERNFYRKMSKAQINFIGY